MDNEIKLMIIASVVASITVITLVSIDTYKQIKLHDCSIVEKTVKGEQK